jgi:hypothetical protein
MKIPVFVLSAFLVSALASQGWLVLAVIDMGKVQAAQGAKIDSMEHTLSVQQQLTKNDGK